MTFEPSRAAAIEKLSIFIENGLLNYSKSRNFDYGPEKRSNISCLSPYITHGVINEQEVIDACLKKYSFIKNEKFIQEVLWRIYWKGWLELRPKVYSDFINDLKKIKNDFKDNKNYLNALEGKTNIECFNYWVNELKSYNYLHNHTRMWFASIWTFTLGLPWQLGAEFFMKYLYDGDAASNTLGWRWVAGIQTKGKQYLASEWNIKKFTDNRFQNIKLIESALPIIDERSYEIKKIGLQNNQIKDEKILLLFENSLSFESSDFRNQTFKKIYLISNNNKNREIQLSEKVINFKNNLQHDQIQSLRKNKIDCEILDIDQIKNIDENFYCIYPNVGENLSYLNSIGIKNFEYLYRKIDQFSWQYCNKGFFNFKNCIPKIIQDFI
tara:strand:+ start:1409 stop:2554 length:1146 start_codon:yes stop_codon:yes gene_type:complete